MSENYVLELEHIRKEYPGVVALKDVTLRLRKGEVLGLIGENGAGKSTLIKVLTGVEERDEGEVLLEGKKIHPKSTNEAQQVGISTVYQEVNLCPNLSVAENIYIGRAPKTKMGAIDWAAMSRDAKELLTKFDLHLDVSPKPENY